MSNAKDTALLEMLQAGVHFGHKTSKKHPKMDPFVFGSRNGISIIDLEQTYEKMEIALKTLEELAENNKKILFLGTKHQAAKLLKETAESVEMPYIIVRWIGGLLTNFGSVSELMRKLTKLKSDRESDVFAQRYTKKERLVIEREIERLTRLVGGIEKMEKLPDALFVVDCQKEKTAVVEANRLGIPVIAIVDTNVNPIRIQYPIPANDDGVKSINYIVTRVQKAVQAGKAKAPVIVVEEPKKKEEEKYIKTATGTTSARAAGKAAVKKEEKPAEEKPKVEEKTEEKNS